MKLSIFVSPIFFKGLVPPTLSPLELSLAMCSCYYVIKLILQSIMSVEHLEFGMFTHFFCCSPQFHFKIIYQRRENIRQLNK